MAKKRVDSPLPTLHRFAPGGFSGRKGLNVVTGATTREGYLAELRALAAEPNWVSFHCNELVCYLVLDDFPSGHPRAGREGLQPQNEQDLAVLRKKCIASMRAWVVRNIHDDASKAKQSSLTLSKAEQRALVMLDRQVGGPKLVRYRGGKWTWPGLEVVDDNPDPATWVGISVLRKLALKGYVVLDEENGVVTLA